MQPNTLLMPKLDRAGDAVPGGIGPGAALFLLRRRGAGALTLDFQEPNYQRLVHFSVLIQASCLSHNDST